MSPNDSLLLGVDQAGAGTMRQPHARAMDAPGGRAAFLAVKRRSVQARAAVLEAWSRDAAPYRSVSPL